jgi:hypothetical protein
VGNVDCCTQAAVFHSLFVECGGSTVSPLSTLIGSTSAEIGPDCVVMSSENEPRRIPGSGVPAIGPSVVGVVGAVGAVEAADFTGWVEVRDGDTTECGLPLPPSAPLAMVHAAVARTAAPTTAAKIDLRMLTTPF